MHLRASGEAARAHPDRVRVTGVDHQLHRPRLLHVHERGIDDRFAVRVDAHHVEAWRARSGRRRHSEGRQSTKNAATASNCTAGSVCGIPPDESGEQRG